MRDRRIVVRVAVLWVVVLLVGGPCLSCCRVRRQLTLSDFDRLELGMSLEEVTCRLGRPPDRPVGSGIRAYGYDLVDGRTVVLVFWDPDGLTDARVYDQDGTWTDLFEQGD